MPIFKEKNLKRNSKQIEYKIKNDGCWECVSHQLNQDGYARINRNGKSTYIHRYIFSLKNEGITKGMHVLHKCDNPQCINLDHLFEGTNLDNIKDKVEKNRQAFVRGEKAGTAKLTAENVKNILKDSRKHKEVAKDYPVCSAHICKIKKGKAWAHITG